jgi:hypothetical protein
MCCWKFLVVDAEKLRESNFQKQIAAGCDNQYM